MVSLRTLDHDYPIVKPELISDLASKLREKLTAHRGWSRAISARLEFEDWTNKQLSELLGDGETKSPILSRLVASGLVEVQISDGPGDSWRLPWEFFLISATKSLRSRSQPLVVFRHLTFRGEESNPEHEIEVVPRRLLVVKSNPGYLGDIYTDNSLQRETENVQLDLGLDSSPPVHNRTRDEMRKEIRERSPNVIHLAAVDAAQARAHLEPQCLKFDDIPEGMMIADAEEPISLQAQELADLMCSSSQSPPLLIGCNFNRSGGAIAPWLVARGAGASVAILYATDDYATGDLLAENFFHNFYAAWRLSKWRLLDAFRLARGEMSNAIESYLGNGLVLWSGRSLLNPERSDRQREQSKINSALPPAEVWREFDRERREPARPREGEPPMRVLVFPRKELNYSLLHNNRSPFDLFYIRKASLRGCLQDVTIEVTLHAGDEKLSYTATDDMISSLWLLHNEVP